MPINIDKINSDIISKIDELLPLLKEKYNRKTPDVMFDMPEVLKFDTLVLPINTIRSAAQSNASSFDPKPLDLAKLNASKHQLLNRLFSDESKLQAEDFPESERDVYRSTSQIRSWLRPLDYMLSFVTDYRILDNYFLLPKTNIELAWDTLLDTTQEHNNTLNLLKHDDKLKYQHTLVDHSVDVLSLILSYLEPEQLIEITHDHALNRVFQTETALNNALPKLEKQGIKDGVFIYINPLALFWNEQLQAALRQVLDEGFHVNLFKTINPKRLIQTPRCDGKDIDLLTPDMFPKSYRAIRGIDAHQRPFISVLNGLNQAVTFFRYFANKHSAKWTINTVGDEDGRELRFDGIRYLNLEQERKEFEQMHYSFDKYQKWIGLFLALPELPWYD